MRRLFLYIIASIFFFSCSYFEEDHQVKKVMRKYLKETLHDPDSMEEINWRITRKSSFKPMDSLDPNSPLVLDREATYFSDKQTLYLVKIEYRAKNGYGAMRRGEEYAFYSEDDKYLQFENVVYSYKLESFIDAPAPSLMEPRRLFLRNDFLENNEGKVTIEDFWKEYPEYN